MLNYFRCRFCGQEFRTDASNCCACSDCSDVIFDDVEIPEPLVSALSAIPTPAAAITDQYDLGYNIRQMLDAIPDNSRDDDPEGHDILDLFGSSDDLVSYLVGQLDNDDRWGSIKTAIVRAYYAGAAVAIKQIKSKED